MLLRATGPFRGKAREDKSIFQLCFILSTKEKVDSTKSLRVGMKNPTTDTCLMQRIRTSSQQTQREGSCTGPHIYPFLHSRVRKPASVVGPHSKKCRHYLLYFSHSHRSMYSLCLYSKWPNCTLQRDFYLAKKKKPCKNK